jgi:hypothetical protein
MGELWALPIFLRHNLIDTLAHILESIIQPQPSPELPNFPAQLAGDGHPNPVNLTATSDTLASAIVANIILSFRTISEQNWNDFFEAVSSLERTLREDPAGIYPLMDFKPEICTEKKSRLSRLQVDWKKMSLPKSYSTWLMKGAQQNLNPPQ